MSQFAAQVFGNTAPCRPMRAGGWRNPVPGLSGVLLRHPAALRMTLDCQIALADGSVDRLIAGRLCAVAGRMIRRDRARRRA